ncbi:MAG TPA: hypothetical protein VNV66_22115 [Pilimelia sp.]|nr:hypothetical protein [Pilimelia sp.]
MSEKERDEQLTPAEVDAAHAEVEAAEEDVEGHSVREERGDVAPYHDVNFGCA